jgi:putative transposase
MSARPVRLGILRARHDVAVQTIPDPACIEMMMTSASRRSVLDYWADNTSGYLDFRGSALFPWVDITLAAGDGRGVQVAKAYEATKALPGSILDGFDGFVVLTHPGLITIVNPKVGQPGQPEMITVGLDGGAGPTAGGKTAPNAGASARSTGRRSRGVRSGCRRSRTRAPWWRGPKGTPSASLHSGPATRARDSGARSGTAGTDSNHAEPAAPNLLARRFAVAEHPAPDRVWCGDITCILTREGWLFLVVLLDLATRRVVGWAMRETLETELPLAALRMALADRRPDAGLLRHTDRGSQCASGAYRAVLAAHGIVQSMSKRGDCYGNSVAESFFATLEHELLAEADFGSRDAARRAIFEFIEVWYNGERRHSSLGYISPAQYERQLSRSARAA